MIDTLILGGGSAGCVLAARLSEDAGRQVMLVEAGRDISAATMPAEVRSRYRGRAYLDADNLWKRLSPRMSTPASPRRYEQARLLGGGSAINALMANRGAPADYDEWELLGASEWNWAACLPAFRKLETDTDFTGELHGTNGPVRIRRTERDRISPFVRAVLNVLDRSGYPNRDDQNGPWEDGSFIGSISVSEQGERIPTSVCYLTDQVRQRPNLSIRTDASVDRILFEGTRATGALLGSGEVIEARNVIVCAGAIHSPAMLLRSGIGPADDLRALGIKVIADRPGVGGNLMEHPSIAVSAFLKKSARTPFPEEHHEQAIVRFSSGLPDTVAGDMHGAILSRSGWHSIGYRLGTLFFWVNKSYSRGRVTLVSSNAQDEPKVEFNMLSDARDLDRLKLAVRFGATAFGSRFVAPLLQQNVEFGAMFVNRTPQQVGFATKRDEHFVEVPRATRLAARGFDAMRKTLTKFVIPASDRLVGHDHAALEKQFLDVAQTQLEAKIPSNSTADDTCRETVTVTE